LENYEMLAEENRFGGVHKRKDTLPKKFSRSLGEVARKFKEI
jgi:hypothetical protein